MIPADTLTRWKEQALKAYTSGPWKVQVCPNPGAFDEYRIITGYDHPQVKGPTSVVGMGIGIGERKHTVWLHEHDARHIANASPDNVLALIAEVEALRAENSRLKAQHDAWFTRMKVAEDEADGLHAEMKIVRAKAAEMIEAAEAASAAKPYRPHVSPYDLSVGNKGLKGLKR